MRTAFSLLCLFAFSSCGCTSEAVEKMGGDELAPWPELDALAGEPLMSVGYPAQMGDIVGAKAAATSETFVTAVQKFEQSPLPSGYSGKEAQKAAAVTAFNNLIEAAKSGTNEDFKAKFDAASQSLGPLRQ